jgi:hypothetical protein
MTTATRFDASIQLEFSSMTPLEPSIIAKSNRYLSAPDTLYSYSFTIEHESLSQRDRRLFDDGDLIPGLAYYWLNLCAQILESNYERNKVTILTVPSQNFLTDLRIEEVCGQIYSNAWTLASAETFIVWGVDPKILHKKRPDFPIPCSGAIFPIYDGLGIGWRTSSEEFSEWSGLT